MQRVSPVLLIALLCGVANISAAQTPTLVAVDHAPTVLPGTCGPAACPSLLQQAGIQGTVTFEFIVSAAGVPDSASMRTMQSTHPLFVAPAKASVLACRFRPGLAGGQAVQTLTTQTVTFTITRADSSHPKQ